MGEVARQYPGTDSHVGIKGAIDDKSDTGWAVDGHNAQRRGNRLAIFQTKSPVVFAGGTRLKVKLKFESGTPHHVLGRFRLATGSGAG